ncbi:HAD family hydrolase [Celerinatantimonas yamalensis]|uniref:HAD-IA family hydrolase n=1 Tax=Celerinatantimonas yamalensis TaxID=559956 RepID=A0ABW9G646_9GAMM
MYALFDLDGTVHDKTQSLKACAESMHNKFLDSGGDANQFIDEFVKENCIIQPKAKVFENLASKFNIEPDIEANMLKYFDESFHNYSKRFDGVLECMNYLKGEGVKIACVTNGRGFFQRNKIKALGLECFFDVIVTSGELSIKKPDPIIFNAALETLGASSDNSVFIGDNLKADMEPSKKLGMRTIWVNNKSDLKPEFVDYKLSSFSEFRGIWQAITRR